jgi:hypothetical protein
VGGKVCLYTFPCLQGCNLVVAYKSDTTMKYNEFEQSVFFFFFCSSGVWTQNLMLARHCATQPALFCDGLFRDRVLWTICLGWLQISILLICASWVARIAGMSHWCLAGIMFCCQRHVGYSQIWNWLKPGLQKRLTCLGTLLLTLSFIIWYIVCSPSCAFTCCSWSSVSKQGKS